MLCTIRDILNMVDKMALLNCRKSGIILGLY